jgi:hypothetical protein
VSELAAPGDPLETNVRRDMEASFSADFGDVRVHTGPAAEASARALPARAYTLGRHVVLGESGSASGMATSRYILAHELTHVLQYRRSGVREPDGEELELTSSAPSETFEREADANARRAAMGLGVLARPAEPAGAHSAAALRASPVLLVARLAPNQVRPDPDLEKQRQDAIQIVGSECAHTQMKAASLGIAPEAIAGAILWEALENPYRRPLWRLGPGKVHPTELSGKSEAERAEAAGLVPAARDSTERENRLQQSGWAVDYIAAIMARHRDNYKTIAGVDISYDVGVLCTLYQGGHSEERAQRLAARRKSDPNAQPVAADQMGPWVLQYLDWVKTAMGCAQAPTPQNPPGQATG